MQNIVLCCFVLFFLNQCWSVGKPIGTPRTRRTPRKFRCLPVALAKGYWGSCCGWLSQGNCTSTPTRSNRCQEDIGVSVASRHQGARKFKVKNTSFLRDKKGTATNTAPSTFEEKIRCSWCRHANICKTRTCLSLELLLFVKELYKKRIFFNDPKSCYSFFTLIVFSGGELPVDNKCEFSIFLWVRASLVESH